MQRLASADQSSSSSNTNLSTSLSLSILDQTGKEMALTTSAEDRFEFIIPRDPTLVVPAMARQNATSLSAIPHSQLFNLHYINIHQSSALTISLHLEMRPVTVNVSYLLIYRFDGSPQLNRSVAQIDGWSLLCASSVYSHFIDNHRTAGHQSVVYGLRELSSKEVNAACVSSSMVGSPPITDQAFNFTSDYELRVYSSGCYYLDAQNRWQSDGLTVRFSLTL
jgi:hypothetical protein